MTPITPDELERSVPERFEIVADRFARRTALLGDDRSWSYDQLNRRVNRIAHALRAAVPQPTGTTAILADLAPDMVVAVLAATKAGRPYTVLHPQSPTAAQRRLLLEADARVLLATAPRLADARSLAHDRCPALGLDDLERQPHAHDHNPPTLAGPDDPMVVFYTSGSTGQPKGVVQSHRTVLHRSMLAQRHDAIVPDDRQSLLTPACFASSLADTFGSLLHGACLCPFEVLAHGLAELDRWIDRQHITVLHPPVLLFRRFLATLTGRDRFPALRTVLLAGEVVLPADLQRWRAIVHPGCVVRHRFSSTEAGLLAVLPITDDRPVQTLEDLCGYPVQDKQLDLLDDHGRPVPPGHIGQLVVTSRYIASGYWKQPATPGVFSPDPDDPRRRVFHTGDLGRFLPDGRFLFLGRRDHQIKVRGYRVELREIEAALALDPAVAECCLLARRIDDEHQLIAFVVPSHRPDPAAMPGPPGPDSVASEPPSPPTLAPDPDALLRRLAASLPPWKLPARILFLDALPVTLTGKVDRQKLESLLDQPSTPTTSHNPHRPGPSGPDRHSSHRPPDPNATAHPDTNPHELLASLTAIWSDALRRDRPDPHDRFLSLGGNSLAAMVIIARIAQHLGITLTPDQILSDNPTLTELADLLARRRGVPPPTPIPRTHRRSPSPSTNNQAPASRPH